MVAAAGPGRAPGKAPTVSTRRKIASEQERLRRNVPYQTAMGVAEGLLGPDLKTNEGRLSAALTFLPGGKLVTVPKAAITGFRAARAAGTVAKAVGTASKTAKAASIGSKGANMANPISPIIKALGAGAKAAAKTAVPTSKVGKAVVSGAARGGKAVGNKGASAFGGYSRAMVLNPAERTAYNAARTAKDAAQARFIKAAGKPYKGRAADMKTMEGFRSSQAQVNRLGRRDLAVKSGVAAGAAGAGAAIGMATNRGNQSTSSRGGTGQGAPMSGGRASGGSRGQGAALGGTQFTRGVKSAKSSSGTTKSMAATGPGASMAGKRSSALSRSGSVSRRAAAPKMMGRTVRQENTEWVKKGDTVNGKTVTKGYLAQKGKLDRRVSANVRIATPSKGEYTAGGGGQMVGGTKKGEVYAYKAGRRTGAMKKK